MAKRELKPRDHKARVSFSGSADSVSAKCWSYLNKDWRDIYFSLIGADGQTVAAVSVRIKHPK